MSIECSLLQSHSLPASSLQREAEERQEQRERAGKRNLHHELRDGGCETSVPAGEHDS